MVWLLQAFTGLIVATGAPPSPPPLVEPYPLLFGDDAHGNPAVAESPDPLVSMTWGSSTNITGLQIYNLSVPDGVVVTPEDAVEGASSLLSTDAVNVTFKDAAIIRLDFGREHAAWFEFTSPDLGSQISSVTASVSEYNEPWPGKTMVPKSYGGGVYRLETNAQLYEGVRYAWISFDPISNPTTCVAHGTEDEAATVSCQAGAGPIKTIEFAEFGTAVGDCKNGFTKGQCVADLKGNLTQACVGKDSCTVSCIQGICTVNGQTFSLGGDPCPGTPKKLTMNVECTKPSTDGGITPWHLTNIRLVAQSKPVNYSGSFKSADTILTQSWYSGAYGSRLNMMPYGFNSILMDRGDRVSIQGDGHPTMAAALVAFGSNDTYNLVHKMLAQTDSGCANSTNCRVVDSSLMPYPIYWASSVNDWYWASGDTERFLELAPDMGRIIDNAVSKFLQPGLNVAWFGWDDRVANGFCGSCNLEAQLGFASMTIRACVDFAATLKKAGDTTNSTRYTATSLRLTKILRDRPSTTTPGGSWYDDYGVHAASYLINAKVVATPDEESELFNKVLTDPVTICSWSPFNQYWILQALGNIGKMDYALASIKLCWGPMLTLGKGCFWELFSPEWTRFMKDGDKAPTRPSYCHPWADGVTHWLSHNVAGIIPLDPGYKRFAAMPHLSTQHPSVFGSMPSPYGIISVNATRDPTFGHIRIQIASETPGVVAVRLHDEATGCPINVSSILVDGVKKESFELQPDVIHPTIASTYTFVKVASGKHQVTAEFSASCVTLFRAEREKLRVRAMSVSQEPGPPDVPPFPVATYPASWSMDNSTHGSWKDKYGKDGYQLFAFNQTGSDITDLPDWVKSISIFKRGSSNFVGQNASNSSYLDDPAGGVASLGFTTAGADGSQGTVLDINVSTTTDYFATLYMVSGVKPQSSRTWSFSKQAIRVMDLETLNPIAPDPLIGNYPGGVYLTVKYNKGMRLRVMPIDSDAGFSAVFLDRPS